MPPIHLLIPQREPILMVDSLVGGGDDWAQTTFAIAEGNLFLLPDGTLSEAGLIENMAQTASAMAGLNAIEAGADAAPVGMIGEVKRFACHRRPTIGEALLTTVRLKAEAGAVSIVGGEVKTAAGETLAETDLKIHIED